MPNQNATRPRRRTPRPVSHFDPLRPFTREEALASGLTIARLRSKAFRRIIHGVYVAASVPDSPELRGEAMLLIAPGVAWVSHASAARILGVPLPVLPGEHLSVAADEDRVRRHDLRCHIGPPSARVIRTDRLQYSSPAQTFVELGEQLTLVDLVVVGDWLVRRKLVTLERLRGFVAASRMKGTAGARVAVGFVREGVDSPMETRLRMLFVLAGFPEPEVNLRIDDVGGEGPRRFDLSWPDVKVIAEYDGRHHVDRETQWAADLERREAIDDDGWRIRIFIASDVYNSPDRTLHRMAHLLRSRGLAAMPATLRDEWRVHFPVKGSYL